MYKLTVLTVSLSVYTIGKPISLLFITTALRSDGNKAGIIKAKAKVIGLKA